MRAASRDPEMVGLLGIRLPRVLTAVFGLGCALAGIAGVLAAPLWTVIPSMSENAIMPAFVVVVIELGDVVDIRCRRLAGDLDHREQPRAVAGRVQSMRVAHDAITASGGEQ